MKFIYFRDVPQESVSTLTTKLNLDEADTCIFEEKKTIRGDVSYLAILGHSGNKAQTLGGLDEAGFVKQLKNKINKKKRPELKHLYLIACEAGMSLDGKPAFAQTLVNALNQAGFMYVQVHALSNPDDRPIHGMRVAIIHNVGSLGDKFNQKPGKLTAFLNETDEQEQLDHQISELQARLETTKEKRELRTIRYDMQQIEKKDAYTNRLIIAETDDLLAELDRPQNTFIANQPRQEKVLAQELLIVHIEAIIRSIPINPSLDQKQKEKLQDNLTNLLEEVRKANQHDWQQVLLDKIKAYGKGANRLFKNNSQFYDCLKELQKEHMTVAQAPHAKGTNALKSRLTFRKKETDGSNEERQSLLQAAAAIESTPSNTQIELKDVSYYYKYANANRFHLYKAKFGVLHGDEAKARILERIQSELKDIQNTDGLERYKTRLFRKNDSRYEDVKYRKLSKGQGLFTRLFGLRTSSQNAVDEMLKEAEEQLSSGKKIN